MRKAFLGRTLTVALIAGLVGGGAPPPEPTRRSAVRDTPSAAR